MSRKLFNDEVYLQSVKNFYKAFAHNSFESIVRTTLDGRIVFCNKRFVEVFGFSSSYKTKGYLIASLFEGENDYSNLSYKVCKNRALLGVTQNFKTLCGKKLTGRINCNLSQDVQGVSMLNWTVLDITKDLEVEENLRMKHEELKKVSETMEKFLYSTSHDLRSPVCSILGLVNLVRLEKMDHQLHDYIDRIESSASRLDVIIHDLMGFAKTSYQRTKNVRVNLSEIVTQTLHRYSHSQHFNRIAFDINCEHSQVFYSDNERVEIILENLIRNTLQFFDINKTRSFVKITAAVTETEAKIEILDNGIGIDKTHQAKIFNMFYKAAENAGGAGLGLFIVKESIDQLKGTISVESEVGFGSIFRITIPNSRIHFDN